MKILRLEPLLLAALLLSGCAVPYRTTGRPVVHPAHQVAKAVTKPDAPQADTAATTSPVIKASVKPATPEPGAAIPLMGFRPMKGQAAPGT